MKPGKPLTFATVPRAAAAPGAPAAARAPLLVFGLPGNPVRAHVCFHLVVVRVRVRVRVRVEGNS